MDAVVTLDNPSRVHLRRLSLSNVSLLRSSRVELSVPRSHYKRNRMDPEQQQFLLRLVLRHEKVK